MAAILQGNILNAVLSSSASFTKTKLEQENRQTVVTAEHAIQHDPNDFYAEKSSRLIFLFNDLHAFLKKRIQKKSCEDTTILPSLFTFSLDLKMIRSEIKSMTPLWPSIADIVLTFLSPIATIIPNHTLTKTGLPSIPKMIDQNLTPEKAQQILKDYFEDLIECLIIDKDQSSMLSLDAALSARMAIPWLKKIAGFSSHELQSAASIERGNESLKTRTEKGLLAYQPLSKPLILLMYYQDPPVLVSQKPSNTSPSANKPGNADLQQWVSCVILPKNYQAPHGNQTGNTVGEVVFYLDPCCTHKPADMPQRFWPFYQMITKGVSFKESVPGSNPPRQVQVVISAPFPKAMFYNGSCRQQTHPSSSLDWSFYNALMTVMMGHSNFMQPIAKSNEKLDDDLKQLWRELISVKPKANITQIKFSSEPPPIVAPLVAEAPVDVGSSGLTASDVSVQNKVIQASAELLRQPPKTVVMSAPKVKEIPIQNVVSTQARNSSSKDDKNDVKLEAESAKLEPRAADMQALLQSVTDAKIFRDKSPAISSYTVKTLAVLLETYGFRKKSDFFRTLKSQPIISKEPVSVLIQGQPQDNNKISDCYYHPLRGLDSDMLLRDNLSYCLQAYSLQKPIANRRVCFLLQGNKGPLALIIQLSQVKSDIFERLKPCFERNKELGILDRADILDSQRAHSSVRKELSQDSQMNNKENEDTKKNIESLITKQELQYFKQLYGQVHAIFLGSAASTELVNQLKPLFEKTFTGKIRLDFKAEALVNPTIAIADDILQMLQKGESRQLETAKLFSEHRAQAIKALMYVLNGMQQRGEHYIKILDSIVILLKYSSLEQVRKTYSIKIALTSTLDELESVQNLDQVWKSQIYSHDYISQLPIALSQLDLEPIVEMLALKDKPDELSNLLDKSVAPALKRIQIWETELKKLIKEKQKTWLPFLWQRGKKTAQFIYQNSLIGLGSQLVHWMGQSFGELIPSRVKKEVRDCIEDFTKWTVMGLSLSPKLAKRAQAASRFLLEKENVSIALRTTGAIAGAFVSYVQGAYTSAKALGITSVTLYCYHQNNSRILDDKAKLIAPRFSFSPVTFMRSLNLIAAMLETIYLKNPGPFVQVLGGVTGSVVATSLAQKYIDLLKITSGKRQTEEQTYILFILSLSGYDIGRGFLEYCYQQYLTIADRYQLHDHIVQRLQILAEEQAIEDFRINSINDRPTMSNPLLWMQPNKISMSWRRPDAHYQDVICEINHDIGSSDNVLNCQSKVTSPQLNF